MHENAVLEIIALIYIGRAPKNTPIVWTLFWKTIDLNVIFI